ncbi:MAG: aspartyl protease family protein [Bacteroidetes bacterium]|nr:aspartyl protease family protein [Bacteroidota bacterium]
MLLDNMMPLEFLLDTGVRTPILTDRLYSDFLNISYDRTLSLRGAGQGDAVQAHMASNVNMMLPNVSVNNQPLLVLEEDYLDLGSQLGVPVHGIIGYELFARFVVKIDYEENLITLYEPEQFKAPRNYDRVDLSIESQKPYIQAEITDEAGQKHIVKLLLDTGASHAILLHTNAENKEAGVPIPEKTIYGSLGRGLLGDIQGHIGRVPHLQMGSHAFTDVLASFPDIKSYTLQNNNSDRDGTMGGEILSRFTVIIDYPHNAIYFQKSQDFKRPFIFNKTGLTIVASGPKLEIKEVADVRKDTPAHRAGIQKHDICFKINGKRTSEVGLSDLSHLLRKRDGKKVRFVFLRNGEKVKVKMRLKDII